MAEALLVRNVLTWDEVQGIMSSITIEKSLTGYVMVFEKSRTGYCAYPDLPGCVTTGRTLAQTLKLMREALVFHQQGMRKAGQRVPRPRPLAELRRKGLVR